jgi:hypothetical protein
VAGTAHDIWTVNVEDEYHEETVSVPASDGGPATPEASRPPHGTGRDAPLLPTSG